MKKKVIAIVLAAIIAAAGIFVWKSGIISGGATGSDDSAEVYVMSLADIMGTNSGYSTNVFMGVVEGQESTGITKSSDRELDQLFVSEGDTVTVGTPLFSYKTDSLVAENTQYGFEIEGYNLSIADYNNDITKTQTELDKIKGNIKIWIERRFMAI